MKTYRGSVPLGLPIFLIIIKKQTAVNFLLLTYVNNSI